MVQRAPFPLIEAWRAPIPQKQNICLPFAKESLEKASA